MQASSRLASVSQVPRKCRASVSQVSRKCLVGLSQVSRKCLASVSQVSRKCQTSRECIGETSIVYAYVKGATVECVYLGWLRPPPGAPQQQWCLRECECDVRVDRHATTHGVPYAIRTIFSPLFVSSFGTPLSNDAEERQWRKYVHRAINVRNRNPTLTEHKCRLCNREEESMLHLVKCCHTKHKHLATLSAHCTSRARVNRAPGPK